MNDNLSENDKKALIAYRIERAESTVGEARVLSTSAYYNAAVNRLYYACYYAAKALLLSHNQTPKTHAGVKTALGLHFISKGILSIESGKTFNTLFEKRHSSDYDDFAFCDKEMIDQLLPQVNDFIQEIKLALNN